MADVSMCRDTECTQRETCFRYKATPSKWYQSYFTNSPRTEKGCDYYWEYKPVYTESTDPIKKFKARLKKLDIDVELVANIPWIYLRKVNGNSIKPEDWDANHGYTLAFYNGSLEFRDLKRTFELIKKYK